MKYVVGVVGIDGITALGPQDNARGRAGTDSGLALQARRHREAHWRLEGRVGDPGSRAWLGRKLLEEVLLAYDHLRASERLDT